jgi:predicted membrane channel-forming protein YqfA (hemolysin III family)
MKLKNKYIISMAIAGLIILLFGSLRKITHQPNAATLLNVAYYIIIGAAVLFLIKVLLHKDKNHFLNK